MNNTKQNWGSFWWIFWREIYGYFFSPLAYIFLIIFLIILNILTFGEQLGNLYGRGTTDLTFVFFVWHPWLFMLLIPAIGMRMWSEERRQGTFELLTTLPISLPHLVLGKFFASAFFLAIVLLLTTPVWFTVAYLGEPDHGKIFSSYLGSYFMGLLFLGIASVTSACSSSQVVALVVSFMLCFIFVLLGFPPMVNLFRSWLPEVVVQWMSLLSVYPHVENFQRGVIDIRDLIYFGVWLIYLLVLTHEILRCKRP